MSDQASAEASAITPAETRPSVTSTWAAASLLCGVAVCCPAMTVISILLGVRALVQIKANPSMRGRGMALTGITLGVLATIGWIVGAIWWHVHARTPMMYGPREALHAGNIGNLAVFKEWFHDDAPAAADSDAITFLAELNSRYGRFVNSTISANPASKPSLTGSTEIVISYSLQFEKQTVESQAAFITFAPSRLIPRPVFKWAWLRITDTQHGDLVYPVAAPLAAPP